MFLTRLGFGSKAVVTGDITQIEVSRPGAHRAGRSDEGRRQRRGHRVHPLRRKGVVRHALRAADREGVRRVQQWIPTVARRRAGALWRGRPARAAVAARAQSRARRCRVGHRQPRPPSCAMVGLAPVARRRRSRSARGELRSLSFRRAHARTNRRLPPKRLRHRRLSFRLDPRAPPRAPRTPHSASRIRYSATCHCHGVARRQAREAGHGIKPSCAFLLCRGLSSSAGYDHEDRADNGRMARAEARLRKRGGLDRGLIARS